MEDLICPSCGGRGLIATDNGKYKCPFCGKLVDPKDEAKKLAEVNKLVTKRQERKEDNKAKEPENTEGYFGNILGRTLAIKAYFNDYVSNGSGFFISGGYLLTNAHVVLDDIENPRRRPEPGYRFTGTHYHSNRVIDFDLIAADVSLDIAILRAHDSKNAYSNLVDERYTGQKVYAVGNSRGDGLCVLEGIVSDECRNVNGRRCFMTSALVTHGNSGGPVFNTNGEVLGMIKSSNTQSVAMNYAIPSEVIKEFIYVVEKDQKIRIL